MNQPQFSEVIDKSIGLAKIFDGIVKTEKSFSICKGVHSIKFNCQNEHTFFMPADKIN